MVKKINYLPHVYVLTIIILFAFGHWIAASVTLAFLIAGLM